MPGSRRPLDGELPERSARRPRMRLVQAPVVDAGEPAVPSRALVVDSLVARLSREFPVDPQVVRDQVEALLATFAAAPVQTFVPVLVAKRLREAYREGRATS